MENMIERSKLDLFILDNGKPIEPEIETQINKETNMLIDIKNVLSEEK